VSVNNDPIAFWSEYTKQVHDAAGAPPVNTAAVSVWRGIGVLLLLSLILLLLLYWSTVVSLVEQWQTSSYSYAFLTAPIAGFLAWRNREQLAKFTPAPAFWALPGIALLGFGWLVGDLTATNFLEHFFFVSVIIVFVWGLVGKRVGNQLLFPLGFLMFAIPAGQDLIPPLQDFSAWSAVKLLELTRIPVLLEGRFISVPYGKWEVAEACSGISYLLASLAVGFVYAGVMYRSWFRRISFLVASFIVPVLANGLRVYGIILLGYLAGSRMAARVDHVLAGFIFFSIVSTSLMLVGLHWRETERHISPRLQAEDPERLPSTLVAAPLPGAAGSLLRSGLFAAFAVLIAGLAPFSARFLGSSPQEEMSGSGFLAVVSLPWKASDQNLYGWTPRFLGPAAEHIQAYRAEDNTLVKLYVKCYGARQKGAKLIGSENRVYEPKEWVRTGDRTVRVSFSGREFSVRETIVHSTQASLIIWNWYSVDGAFTSNSWMAKFLLARAWLTGSHRISAAIVVAAEKLPPGPQGASALRDFLGHLSLREYREQIRVSNR
jgi:exosortase A